MSREIKNENSFVTVFHCQRNDYLNFTFLYIFQTTGCDRSYFVHADFDFPESYTINVSERELYKNNCLNLYLRATFENFQWPHIYFLAEQ